MTEDADNVQRTLGRIEGRLDAQDQRHDEMRTMLGQQNDKLDALIRGMERDKGERTGHRRAAAVVSGLVSLLVSGVAVAVSWIAGKN